MKSSMQRLIDIMNSTAGSIVTSAVIGFGLATLFQQSCVGHCIVIDAPDISELRRNVYDYDGTCYKYTPRAVKCGHDENARH